MKYDILSIELENETLYFFRENPYVMEEDEIGEKRYFYEEHQCATNLVEGFKEIFSLKEGEYDSDPHGIFTYETTIETDITETTKLVEVFKTHLKKINETV